MPILISNGQKIERMKTPKSLEHDLKKLLEEVEDLFFFSPEENHVSLADEVEKKVKDICDAARKGEYF